jgi:cytochrome c-type biogenesis protein CcmH/NrfG
VKKETLTIVVTAAVFFAVGFLAGYITDAQMHFNKQQPSTMAAGMPPPGDASGGQQSAASSMPGLPEGHPAITSSQITKTLQDEAAAAPQNPEPLLKLANYLYDQKQYSQAIEYYEKALALDGKNVNARTDLGTAYFYLGQSQQALKEYQQSLQIDPSHGPTLFNTIVVYLEGLKDVPAAQKAYDRLFKLNPNYPGLDGMKQKLDEARGSRGTSN